MSILNALRVKNAMSVVVLSALSVLNAGQVAFSADRLPSDALQYRRTLVRAAHQGWGLDAPIATFAAQVHQESRWNASARSRVGAQGLAQFMPATADWMADLYPETLGAAAPYQPAWALRALVAYNRWLYVRTQGNTPCDHWAFVLSAYNGGLGWVLRDQQQARQAGADAGRWEAVAPFNAGRSAANFRENRQYPRLILQRFEPLYVSAQWGAGVCP